MRKGFIIALAMLILAIFIGTPGTVESAGGKQKKVIIINNSGKKAEVNINFSDLSEVNRDTLGTFCDKRVTASKLNCGFDLEPVGRTNSTKEITNPYFRTLSMSMAFNKPVDCGATKAELTINASKDDVMDVSLVDGFNEKVKMVFTPSLGQPTIAGPANAITGNENIAGVYPYGCDGCAARIAPQKKCGPYPMGNSGCHGGAQYDPKPKCELRLNESNGIIEIILMP
jgi:hypothetical protein